MSTEYQGRAVLGLLMASLMDNYFLSFAQYFWMKDAWTWLLQIEGTLRQISREASILLALVFAFWSVRKEALLEATRSECLLFLEVTWEKIPNFTLCLGEKHLKHITKLRKEDNQWRPTFGEPPHIFKCFWSVGIFLRNFVTYRRINLWE